MSSALYNERLVAHSRHPTGAADWPAGDGDATADNPVCGDEIRLRIVWGDGAEGRVVERVEHVTRGCAVCKASASLAAGAAAGKSREELRALADAFEECLGEGDFAALGGDFRMLDGITAYPSRVHCARLPWTALRRALEASGE